MKILILIFIIQSALAQVTPQSSCPYLIKDQDSYDILKSTTPVLEAEMNRIKQEMDDEKSNCLLPPIEEVARSEQLIHALATKMVPPNRSFDSLILAGQQISCTTSATGFKEVVDSYKSFVMEGFDSLPAKESDLDNYLELSGTDGAKINNIFYDCHRQQVGVSTKKDVFVQCLDKNLYGQGSEDRESIVYQVWNTNCGQDLSEKSLAIQKILNQSEQDSNKRQTTEDLISATYQQISNTIDTLMKTDPKCKFSSQMANMGNSLVSASVGVGQLLGSPWSGLALNLAARPISSIINAFAQKDQRNQEKDLKLLYQQINNIDKERNEEILCAMLSMQKLKCDTFKDYNGKSETCEITSTGINQTLNVSGLTDLIVKLKNEELRSESLAGAELTDENAMNYLQDKTIEQMSELNRLFFNPTSGLKLDIGKVEDLSVFEYLYGKGSSKGIIDQVDVNKMDVMSEKIKFNKEKIGLDELKESLTSFKISLDKITAGDLSGPTANAVLSNYRKVLGSLIESKPAPEIDQNKSTEEEEEEEESQIKAAKTFVNKPALNFPFVLTKYFEQMSKGDVQSDAYKFAMKEIKIVAGSAIEKTKTSSVKGLAVSDRFNNTENYFNFMSSHYSQQEILIPIIENIQPSSISKSSSTSEKELHFDAKVLPALRDCLFLYQPVMMSGSTKYDKNSKAMIDNYQTKCGFALNCQKNLGFTLGKTPSGNLNDSTRFDEFQPICHVQRNFGFIFSKARSNYMKSGNVCTQ